MKFNFKGQVTVQELPEQPGVFMVIKGNWFVTEGETVYLDQLKQYFTPADCNALNLVDPDRNNRLCQPVIGGASKPAPGGIKQNQNGEV